jgi:hypothetical protein
MKEEWRDIRGFEGLYQASNLGRIRSIDHTARARANKTRTVKGRILKPTVSHGLTYRTVSFWVEVKQERFYVHRLVATAFVPNPHGYLTVNHKDENKENNSARNLEWCTHAQNMAHAATHKLMKGNSISKGEQNHQSKLTDTQVSEIKRRLSIGESCQCISRDYPVGKSAIGEIKRGRSWRHVQANADARRSRGWCYDHQD